jgi:hypothetical protein
MLPPVTPFTQIRYGDLSKLPRAAGRLWELVRYRQRLGKEIDRLKDWEWGELLNVGRRCIQKGWKQLELFGYVKRVHEKRRRLIKILIHFPSKSKAAATAKPASAASAPAPMPVPAEETVVPATPEEIEAIKAEWAKIRAEARAAAQPAKPTTPTPTPSQQEKIDRAQAQQKEMLAYFAARKAASQPSLPPPEDVPPPAAPPTPQRE